MVNYGFFGPIDIAVIESSEVSNDARLCVTRGIGDFRVFLQEVRQVIME